MVGANWCAFVQQWTAATGVVAFSYEKSYDFLYSVKCVRNKGWVVKEREQQTSSLFVFLISAWIMNAIQ